MIMIPDYDSFVIVIWLLKNNNSLVFLPFFLAEGGQPTERNVFKWILKITKSYYNNI